MDNKITTHASKFLSLVLRHQPEIINLEIDEYGWALIDDIIALSRDKIRLTRELIEEVVITSDKQRYSLSDDGKYIRANQGHSIKVNLQLHPKEPPAMLYHGTATRFVESIKAEGLKPGKRQHVHLSSNIETAISVGSRHGKPTVIKIQAELMHTQGYEFFLSDNEVWLTSSVPLEFLIF